MITDNQQTMPASTTSVAYLIVVVVWSTTPLAVVWSSETVSPIMAVMLRMGIAALIGTLALQLWRIPLPLHNSALKSYAYAVLGIYGAMLLTYLAATQVPSGLISLIFGLSPMITGLLGFFWLQEKGFSPIRWLALLIAMAGLARVLDDGLNLGDAQLLGITLMLGAVLVFSASGVLIKGAGTQLHPLAHTVGALWLSMPLYALTWYLFDAQLPTLDPGNHSFWAILYLAIFGSLVGFVSYFYVLQKLSPSTVALVTLITPVVALALGNLLNNEVLTVALLQGAALICTGLAVYHWGDRLINRMRPSPPCLEPSSDQ